jgi:hypothetical protein
METGCWANLKTGYTALVGCPSMCSQLPFISGDCIYQHPYDAPCQGISWTVEQNELSNVIPFYIDVKEKFTISGVMLDCSVVCLVKLSVTHII